MLQSDVFEEDYCYFTKEFNQGENPWPFSQQSAASFLRADAELFRYWSPRSQAYASGDQLLYFLSEGWTPDTIVEVETHWFGEARHILIYHFRLRKDNNELPMRVLGNPFAYGLVNDGHLESGTGPPSPPVSQRQPGCGHAINGSPGGAVFFIRFVRSARKARARSRFSVTRQRRGASSAWRAADGAAAALAGLAPPH